MQIACSEWTRRRRRSGGGGIYVANLAQFVEIAHKCGGIEVTEIYLPPMKIANGMK